MRQDHKTSYTKIQLAFKINQPVLALGSHSKNTVCFAKGNWAYLSPGHADLNIPKDFLSFEKQVKYFLRGSPRIIAHDLHPEYQSSKFLGKLSSIHRAARSPIQHHHAHIASCMAENGLGNEKVIGVVFDGTGLGSDGRLWGGEFLICDYKNFKRAGHLKEIPLLGGEKAIQEPYRLAVCWLYSVYKDRFLSLKINFVKCIDKNKWRVLKQMYVSGFNSPRSSSMGRLFDAAAAIILEKCKAGFEAELAIQLEKIASKNSQGAAAYNFNIIKQKESYIIDPGIMFKQIIRDIRFKQPREKIAYGFHLTVAEMINKTCLTLRKKSKINKVFLSGGVFQNKLLLRLAAGLLYKQGFEVFTHKRLSCNDSGISLGQAAIANFRS